MTSLVFLLSAIMIWRGMIVLTATRYRPERHYMRGPGPKWRARHQRPTDDAGI